MVIRVVKGIVIIRTRGPSQIQIRSPNGWSRLMFTSRIAAEGEQDPELNARSLSGKFLW